MDTFSNYLSMVFIIFLSLYVVIAGGHAYLLNADRGDNYARIQNSWGPDWGLNGQVWISFTDWQKLFNYDGQAVAAVKLENYHAVKPCWVWEWIQSMKK